MTQVAAAERASKVIHEAPWNATRSWLQRCGLWAPSTIRPEGLSSGQQEKLRRISAVLGWCQFDLNAWQKGSLTGASEFLLLQAGKVANQAELEEPDSPFDPTVFDAPNHYLKLVTFSPDRRHQTDRNGRAMPTTRLLYVMAIGHGRPYAIQGEAVDAGWQVDEGTPPVVADYLHTVLEPIPLGRVVPLSDGDLGWIAMSVGNVGTNIIQQAALPNPGTRSSG